MNQMLQTMCERHTAMLNFWDVSARGEIETVADRAQRSHVTLIAGGQVGLQTARHLARTPLASLTVFGITPQDAQAAQPISHDPLNAARIVAVPPNGFKLPGVSVVFSRCHIVVVATDRPYPGLLKQINEVCVRIGTAWTNGSLWGAYFSLGPTVIPGVTACYNCFERRLDANARNLDAAHAVRAFLTNDDSFDFRGKLEPVVQIAAAYIAEETIRFLTGEGVPAALSSYFTFSVLAQFQEANFVTPLEWCPVCHERHEAARHGSELDTLQAMIARQLKLQGEKI